MNAFLSACKDGHYREAQSMLEQAASAHVDSYDRNGLTALMCASKGGYYVVVELLLRNGAQVNLQDSRGWSALMYACLAGHYRVAKVLLKYGANTDLQSCSWESAYSLALLHKNSKISTLLEEEAS